MEAGPSPALPLGQVVSSRPVRRERGLGGPEETVFAVLKSRAVFLFPSLRLPSLGEPSCSAGRIVAFRCATEVLFEQNVSVLPLHFDSIVGFVVL